MLVTDFVQFIVGTYTDSPSISEGVACIMLDPATGELHRDQRFVPQSLLAHRNPSYITSTKHGLYTINEVERSNKPELTFVNTNGSNALPISGDYPCHLDVHNRLLAVANYGSGNVSIYQLDEMGNPLDLMTELYVEGQGPNLDRQTSPHAHQVTFLKHTNQLAVVDLGSDRVYLYDYDKDLYTFSLTQNIEMPAGAGPRHLVFNHDETLAYVVCELSETLVVMAKIGGLWTKNQELKLLGNDVSQEAAAAIRLSPDQRFVYVSCRAQNKISVFEQRRENVVRLGTYDSGGEFPRDFVLSHDGQWLLVAHQHSYSIVSFRCNRETGAIYPSGYSCEVGSPVCLIEKRSS
ncbi:lactonase family protein [Vibrio alfacsensis]|uniref:lactonase family protein n=1 Tax=Vibrio alfacsensis TaxID=1074311 RepID=UPI002ADD39FC|nr:lactonase family protein [Vibrio alfacsensis]WQE77950.1 lactonase family protein [Vibrio alfacsensis]